MNKKLSDFKMIIGLSIISFLFICMMVSFFYLPYNPNDVDIANKLQLFSHEHFFGTDNLGRDVFSRILISLRISFFIGFIAASFGLVAGVLIGSAGGYFVGFIDSGITKIIDILMAFPGILLALMIAAVFGPGLKNTILALSIMSIPRFARISRSGFLKLRDSPLVMAEKARGASAIRIMFIHILPNISSELVITYSLSFAFSIMNEAGLSYLGLGVQPPNASFGKMLNDAQKSIFTTPHLILVPSITLALLVIGFTLISDGIISARESKNER